MHQCVTKQLTTIIIVLGVIKDIDIPFRLQRYEFNFIYASLQPLFLPAVELALTTKCLEVRIIERKTERKIHYSLFF